MTRVLFICSRNKLRSPTAEAIFSSQPSLEVMSAGVNPDATNRVCADDIEWANIIFVMEAGHKRKLNTMFRSLVRDKSIVVLQIPDEFTYMDAKLIAILRDRVPKHLPSGAT